MYVKTDLSGHTENLADKLLIIWRVDLGGIKIKFRIREEDVKNMSTGILFDI